VFLEEASREEKEGRKEGMPAGQRRRIEGGGKCKGIPFLRIRQ